MKYRRQTLKSDAHLAATKEDNNDWELELEIVTESEGKFYEVTLTHNEDLKDSQRFDNTPNGLHFALVYYKLMKAEYL